MKRGNMTLNRGGRPASDPAKERLTAGKDVSQRDDQLRVSPRLRKLLTAKLAARALGKR